MQFAITANKLQFGLYLPDFQFDELPVSVQQHFVHSLVDCLARRFSEVTPLRTVCFKSELTYLLI